jgi:hypothetical protein
MAARTGQTEGGGGSSPPPIERHATAITLSLHWIAPGVGVLRLDGEPIGSLEARGDAWVPSAKDFPGAGPHARALDALQTLIAHRAATLARRLV